MSLVSDIITTVNALKTNKYTDAQKLAWINEVEESIKLDIMKTFKYSDILRVSGTSSYDLPVGVTFDSIDVVYLEDKPIRKIDYRSYKETGYYNDAGKIGIYPVPTISDAEGAAGIRVVYLEKFTPYTATTATLLIPNQYKKVYEDYLYSKIDRFNEEFEKYNNSAEIFNASWMEFKNWYEERMPNDKPQNPKIIW